MSTKIKTEHTGAKNGGGYWGARADAKKVSASKRRVADKQAVQVCDDDLDRDPVVTAKHTGITTDDL